MTKWKKHAGFSLDEPVPGLFAFTSPAGGRKQRHCYFMPRDDGNLLFHGPDEPAFYREYAAFFQEHGGIARQVLTHGPESSKACTLVEKEYGAPIHVHAWDKPIVEHHTGQPLAHAFAARHCLTDDLEAVHLPGHTAGFTAYVWSAQDVRYLFGGDMLVRNPKGQWMRRSGRLCSSSGSAA